ncbi:recombination regulator RecX [Gammaproteobacteria bacterium]|jgi:regulatory protein|nr:recombination regulator RecX [Gammaproteobacteria bacterium]
MSAEAFTVIYNKALDLVSRREHSRHELMQKLDKRYPETDPIIEEVLDKLEFNQILDDERFAEMYLNSRARKGFGPKKIEMELHSKKVDSFFISNAVEAYESWLENAQKELKKKFKNNKPTDYQSKMKQKQFLFTRGFSSPIIDKIL